MSNVTNMMEMFKEAKAFNQPIGNWDVSNVTDMQSMFYYAPLFNKDIGNWNVSNVSTTMNMFALSPFNQPIGNWDLSKVTSMRRMFSRKHSSHRSNLTQIPITNWLVKWRKSKHIHRSGYIAYVPITNIFIE